MRTTTTSLSALRWRARLPRMLAVTTVAILCLAGARAALRPVPETAGYRVPHTASSDTQAEAFAQTFARAYLTWDGSRPDARERALAQLMSSALDPDGGVKVPRAARQRAMWTTLTSSAPVPEGRRVGVDVGTDRGEWHLSVVVGRDKTRRLSVASYPALTGPLPSTATAAPAPLTPVTDPQLLITARRLVRNYLARARENLGADLAPGATVVLPDRRLTVRSIGDIGWTAPRTLRVEASVRRPDGVELTLAYDLDVVRRAGRWLVRSLLSTPTHKETTP